VFDAPIVPNLCLVKKKPHEVARHATAVTKPGEKTAESMNYMLVLATQSNHVY